MAERDRQQDAASGEPPRGEGERGGGTGAKRGGEPESALGGGTATRSGTAPYPGEDE